MKKNLTAILITCFILIAITMAIMAQDRTGNQPISSIQINSAINTFAQLVNDKNAADFGLQNAAQLKTLKPGKEFTKYMIQLDDLKNYKTGSDVNKIIRQLSSTEIALVDDNNRFVTSIEFTQVKGEWQATGFGASTDLKTIYNQRSPLPDSVITAGKLIRVPALRTNFIGITTATGLNFLITEDNENLGFKRGALIPADEALVKLSDAAKIYNGLPD
jgi:hypothetical protein